MCVLEKKGSSGQIHTHMYILKGSAKYSMQTNDEHVLQQTRQEYVFKIKICVHTLSDFQGISQILIYET